MWKWSTTNWRFQKWLNNTLGINTLVLNCFRLKKGRATFFRPETIVAIFLHSMVLLPKVLFNQYYSVLLCIKSMTIHFIASWKYTLAIFQKSLQIHLKKFLKRYTVTPEKNILLMKWFEFKNWRKYFSEKSKICHQIT